jgi:hypothetical protein
MKRLNRLDWVLIALALAVGLGVLAVQVGMHRTARQVVKGETDILLTVYLMHLRTLGPNVFIPGGKASLTIRNVPRGELVIQAVRSFPKLALVTTLQGTEKAVPDLSDPLARNYLVTLKDHAVVTPDGYVSEGIKVKKGLPVEIEGFDYRVTGVIVDVQGAKSGVSRSAAASSPTREAQ